MEELGIFEHHWQIPRRKSLPVVRLFSLYDPWRRGKRVGTCFWSGLRAENDFNPIPFLNCQKNLRQFFFQESRVWEELGTFEHYWQIPHRKSLPVVRLLFLYDPWRRGKSGTDRFAADLAPKMTFIRNRFGRIIL